MPIELEIGGEVKISGLSPKLMEAIKRKLELPNKDYQQALKRNPNARFYLSPVIKYYEQRDKDLFVPRGVLESIRRFLDGKSCSYKTKDRRISKPTTIKSSIILRSYQHGSVDIISKSTNGIIRADTGYGKTILAIKTIDKIGQQTLIIVPTLNLLKQFVYDIEKFTNISPGIIQGRKFSIGDITVGTWQTIGKRLGEGRLSGNEFGCVIVDECHGSVSPNRRNVLRNFNSAYRYGLTATARRTDGQGHALQWLFGPIIFDGKIERQAPTVEIVKFDGHIWVQEYADMITEQIENEDRNDLITGIIQREIDEGRKVLVLTKRIKHYEILKEEINRELVYTISSGNTDAFDTPNLLSLKGDPSLFNCLLGTFSLLGTGVDIPSLDTLIIAGDLKSDVLAEQSAGRILRLLDGKNTPRLIDVQDTRNGILRNQARLRTKFYKEQGWEIIKGND
jgi:superfamily II DNA or RNA helicase